MPHVFISYQQSDADFAAIVEVELERAGFDTWMDKNRLRPGMDWSTEIDRGVLDALALVVVMSPKARASEYVTYEWSLAIGAGTPVVPLLRVETELHPRLSRLQYLDFTGKVRPWADLVGELETVRSSSRLWTPPRGTGSHILAAVRALDSPNIRDRAEAVRSLAILADTDETALAAIRQALSHPYKDVQGEAVKALMPLRPMDLLDARFLRLIEEDFRREIRHLLSLSDRSNNLQEFLRDLEAVDHLLPNSHLHWLKCQLGILDWLHGLRQEEGDAARSQLILDSILADPRAFEYLWKLVNNSDELLALGLRQKIQSRLSLER